MTWTLGDTSLPRPISFTRAYIERAASNNTLNGETTKRIENRKERFTLEFKNLSQAEADSIFSEYNLQAVRNFSVTEGDLTISSTSTLIDIKSRDYENKDKEYTENIILILTEVL